MTVRLVTEHTSYQWGDQIVATYGGDPADLHRTAQLSGGVDLLGTRTPLTVDLTFDATFEEPVLDGYEFTVSASDPKTWIGLPT
jgi:hypothetical protein